MDFTAEEIGNGLFVFTGRVIDENPAGLVITFGGGVARVQGLTTVVESDGTFILTVRLNTDGTDVGTVSVTTADGQGIGFQRGSLVREPDSPVRRRGVSREA